MKRISIFIALLLWLTPAMSRAGAADIYPDPAQAKTDIAQAMRQAAAGYKRVLVDFGGNWCGDCKMLDIEMHQGDLARLVNDRLVVVKVDVGRFDKNLDVVDRYGKILKNGVPSVALLRSDGTVVYQTDGGELADARKMGREGVTKFFVAMLDKAKK